MEEFHARVDKQVISVSMATATCDQSIRFDNNKETTTSLTVSISIQSNWGLQIGK